MVWKSSADLCLDKTDKRLLVGHNLQALHPLESVGAAFILVVHMSQQEQLQNKLRNMELNNDREVVSIKLYTYSLVVLTVGSHNCLHKKLCSNIVFSFSP